MKKYLKEDPSKVLFLDIDGVLNSDNFFSSKYHDWLKLSRGEHGVMHDPRACVLLGKIKKITNCKIVMSSSWRGFYFSKRKDAKYLALKRKITVNGEIIFRSDIKVDPDKDVIAIDGKNINVKDHVYLILNKPAGYISATEDRSQKTVLDLIDSKYAHRELFPAGRLDKDTTGMMIITDDGQFAHNILAPNKHISKTYEVTIDIPVTEEMKIGFEKGVNLNDGVCKTAKLEITGENTAIVILTEGRYHQIKRMFGCFGAKVTKLHRTAMGYLRLPEDLLEGSSRELSNEELDLLTRR